MRFLVQRVKKASVTVDDKVIGEIEQGLLVFIGVGMNDTKEDADRLIKKLIALRIFSDENDKINLSLGDVSGSLLLVSQFTLYADCRKGNRPSFGNAAKPELANALYEYIIEECKKKVLCVETGQFGADMQVNIMNDGPFTVMLD